MQHMESRGVMQHMERRGVSDAAYGTQGCDAGV